MSDKKYIVKVDDNYHYMDETERYEGNCYSNAEEAISECKRIVIESLESFYKKGIDANKLLSQWAMFGDDPFICGPESKVLFSAREFVTGDLCSQIIKEKDKLSF